MREGFIPFNPHPKTMGLIHLANEIIDQLATMGYSLTLRQLYYQLVARDVIRNKQTEYKRLGKIINEARLAGLVDWDAIEDRTRNLRGVTHYVDPTDVLGFAAGSFRLDKWANQEKRVEVWVEKDALVQVLEKACTPLDVDYFSCRGYTSQSEVYGASKRLLRYIEAGQTPVIIHLGDHDPSGIDMTRDIIDRVNMFLAPYWGEEITVERIALNMNQVRQYNPPPNPAKQTDSRYKQYKAKHGVHCWELDALNPQVIDELITKRVLAHRDDDKWAEMEKEEEAHREKLRACTDRWDEVKAVLNFDPATYRIINRVTPENPINLKPTSRKSKNKTNRK